jgi:uncharacterized protein YraI
MATKNPSTKDSRWILVTLIGLKTLGELVAAIYQTINYYNQRRIHSAYGVPPVVFAQQQETKYY